MKHFIRHGGRYLAARAEHETSALGEAETIEGALVALLRSRLKQVSDGVQIALVALPCRGIDVSRFLEAHHVIDVEQVATGLRHITEQRGGIPADVEFEQAARVVDSSGDLLLIWQLLGGRF